MIIIIIVAIVVIMSWSYPNFWGKLFYFPPCWKGWTMMVFLILLFQDLIQMLNALIYFVTVDTSVIALSISIIITILFLVLMLNFNLIDWAIEGTI